MSTTPNWEESKRMLMLRVFLLNRSRGYRTLEPIGDGQMANIIRAIHKIREDSSLSSYLD